MAVCFLNRSGRPQSISYDWKAHLVNDKITKTDIDFNKATYKLRDIWAKKEVGTTDKTFRQTIETNDVVMLRLTN